MDPRLRELRATGRCVVEPLSVRQVSETNAWLLSRTVYENAHVKVTAVNRGDAVPVPRESASSECLCVDYKDAIVAPHLLERALALTDVAAAYLGRDPPTLYSANAFWTRPGGAELRADIQAYHRDEDDVSFLVMFVFLTDVLTEADGPQDLVGPDGVVRTTCGPAGTVFLADTSRLHRGHKPRSRERGLAWFRWGASERPAANVWDGVVPVGRDELGDRYPMDPRLRESLRLLAA